MLLLFLSFVFITFRVYDAVDLFSVFDCLCVIMCVFLFVSSSIVVRAFVCACVCVCVCGWRKHTSIRLSVRGWETTTIALRSRFPPFYFSS